MTLRFRLGGLLAAVTVLMTAASAPAADLHWEPLCEPGSGGAMVDLSVSPSDSSQVLVSGDMLGIGVSDDGGDSWHAGFGLRAWNAAASPGTRPTPRRSGPA